MAQPLPLRGRRTALLPSLLLALSSALAAQTTGVPGINDYTINAFGSGGSSCVPLCAPAPTTLNLAVSSVPGNPVMFVITDCPCRACVFPWLPNGCLPAIPPATFPPCNSTTNQSLDLFLPAPGCTILFSAFLITNAAGIASLPLNVPTLSSVPCGVPLSTQAVVFDVCGTGGNPPGPGPLVLTQAFQLTL
ncbi:MAG: hypothetical protein AB7O97_10225 [Planctomycetota bacterium]